jgi:uncharacterized protein (TIGR02246 family)
MGTVRRCGAAEQELIELQHRWAAARVKGDTAFLERLYAKEFRIVTIDGSFSDCDADIALFSSGLLKPEYIRDEDMEVSIYGDVAIVTGRELMGGTYKGERGELAVRFTSVYVRRDGRWQIVAGHATQLPKR